MTPVEIHVDGTKVATGQIGPDGSIYAVQPFEGRGLGYGRWPQVTVTAGKHTGATVTALVMGDTGSKLTFKEPLPFIEPAPMYFGD